MSALSDRDPSSVAAGVKSRGFQPRPTMTSPDRDPSFPSPFISKEKRIPLPIYHVIEDRISGRTTTATDLFLHLDAVVPLRNYGTDTLARDRALVHQAVTEIGYHGFRTEHLEGSLKALPEPDYAIFTPTGAGTVFNPSAMKRVLQYLEVESEHVLLLYGANDPWTACAAPLAAKPSNLKLVVPGRGHKFRLGDLPEDMKREVDSALEEWLRLDRKMDTAE